MSAPVFIHVLSTGDIWFSNRKSDTPTGTITATYKVNSDAKFQKIGTLSGTAGSSLTATGSMSKEAAELT